MIADTVVHLLTKITPGVTTIWILGVLAASACITLAASFVDRAAQLSGRPRRWIWVAAMASSCIVAIVSLVRAMESPTIVVPEATAGIAAGLQVPPSIIGTGVTRMTQLAWLRPLFAVHSQSLFLIWGIISAAAALLLLGMHAWLTMQRRRWMRGTVESLPVLVTPNLGPAVVGVIKPVVVLPAWLLNASDDARRMIIQHEREHVAAGDSRMLMLAAILVVLMPWNVVLWWQYRRLHATIENDCDARVLSRGADVRQYSEVLMHVAARTMPMHLSVGFCLRHSHLRHRIVAMTERRRGNAGVKRGVLLGMAGVALFGAIEASANAHPVTVFVAPGNLPLPFHAEFKGQFTFTVVPSNRGTIGLADSSTLTFTQSDSAPKTAMHVELVQDSKTPATWRARTPIVFTIPVSLTATHRGVK